MPVKRRMMKSKRSGCSDLTWAFLMDEAPDREDAPDGIEWWCHACAPATDDMGRLGRPSLQSLWEQYRVEVLEAWLVDRPGTRPSSWWRWDAPQWGARDATEAQAAYLRRHGLFEHGEESRMTSADFLPVRVGHRGRD